MEPEGLLPPPQEPATNVLPEADQSGIKCVCKSVSDYDVQPRDV
jgi:hypothetical protein